jgi:hypothetical protein
VAPTKPVTYSEWHPQNLSTYKTVENRTYFVQPSDTDKKERKKKREGKEKQGKKEQTTKRRGGGRERIKVQLQPSVLLLKAQGLQG